MDETQEESYSVIIRTDSPREGSGGCDAFWRRFRSVKFGDLSSVLDDDGKTLFVQPALFGNVASLEVREVIMFVPGPQLNTAERRMSSGIRRQSNLSRLPPPLVIGGQTNGSTLTTE